MQQEAVQQLIDQLPDQAGSFRGSEYLEPIRSTFLGDRPLDISLLRTKLVKAQASPVKDLLEFILLADEAIESVQDDKEKYLITDWMTQSLVFIGSKWRVGGVLVLGGEDQNELIAQLKQLDFMVYRVYGANITSGPD
jgi:hypothetical protein